MNKLAIELQKAFYFAKYGEGWEGMESVENSLFLVKKTHLLLQKGCIHDGNFIMRHSKCEMPEVLRGGSFEVLGRPIEATALLDVLGSDYFYNDSIIMLTYDFCSFDEICDWKPNTPLHLQSEKTQKILLPLIQKLK